MLTPNAIKVLEKRYLLRNDEGALNETSDGLFERVAACVASSERKFGLDDVRVAVLKKNFFDLMRSGEFLPNSPTLMNAGKPKGQLSACFVLPVPDSLEGIFESCKNAALIHKTGGGTGFSFSRIRPANDRVATSTGVASGPISFMTVFDAATEAIRQGGTRRGANMGILRVDHPDIESFITCKKDTSRLNNFNISVAATDKFMEAVESDSDYEIVHPNTKAVVRRLKARVIFEQMIENAHATGEPGLVFIDRINAEDPVYEAFDIDGTLIPGTENIEATNPCGEQPLGPGDACNLGSINLAAFVDSKTNDFDWSRLEQTINLSVRFLDDVVEANHYPLPFIERATKNNRRIGLGIMGWADALIMMRIAYNSEKAIEKADQLMSFLQDKAHRASTDLAEIRGCFPNWSSSKWGDCNQLMRNATVTTIAPTGTISIIAGTSSGIEPLFAISFVRRVLSGAELIEANPLFEKVARERGFYSDELMEQIAREGTLADCEDVPVDVRSVFVCSHDISYEWHVRMQAAFQKHTDNAVSKTINLPHYAPVADVRASYLDAWRLGLKGITVYRDASRASQVLNIRKTDALKSDTKYGDSFQRISDRAGRSEKKALTVAASSASNVATLVLSSDSVNQGSTTVENDKVSIRVCIECGSHSANEARYEACVMCRVCGYTKC
ncbi:MAG: adenosylcobalamin-dependent ribonucleoside-diphosphate reductase [Candidatus Obscuribacterales bacterium]|nr:adenosylcobalamin-dependent ribonucleoside-diphosphate reductase [Candidatus Obscuribacterales bacterium]